ncbi:hypothetical protein BJ875DRAFT_214812 [Amylocarpus encephaloides]|uniref:Uncharacterized protein n=1 Tax=Amylocarpus encephaloides TaxID=45428 RepID=A0A9P7Y8A7_9HELO|nr:hypothetical protein BJ875DRAFT_214812 [Amylocarpus encephaloides]
MNVFRSSVVFPTVGSARPPAAAAIFFALLTVRVASNTIGSPDASRNEAILVAGPGDPQGGRRWADPWVTSRSDSVRWDSTGLEPRRTPGANVAGKGTWAMVATGIRLPPSPSVVSGWVACVRACVAGGGMQLDRVDKWNLAMSRGSGWMLLQLGMVSLARARKENAFS